MADTSVSYKCPNCSAPLSFLPGHDKVTCEYCGTEFEIKTIEEMFNKQEERAAQAAEAKEAKWDTEHAGSEFTEDESAFLKTFTCSSCGAELVCDENTMATECCYCGNPTMIPSRFKGMLKPDYVIPFKKTKEEAVEALKKFYEGRKLLPDAFTANNRVEDIQPMYVPFLLFDSEVTASAVFKAENDMVIDTPDAIITETSVYDVERVGTMKFERIPVDGSEKMDDAYMESIEPFDYSEMVPFTTAYLTGYLADKYDVSAEDSVPRADKRVEHSAAGVLEGTVTGYLRHQMESCAVRKDVGSVKYALVPVWILTTRYQNQPYTFMMNGQTGKFIGSLPWDKGKATKYQALATLIPAPIIYFLAKFLIG
ncbi:MAG: hypothetical protein IJ625_01455 [Acidaminococcaceae bacterium]|nr:hypothetical protein [Acidaminococcaceae bacterium]